MGVNALVQQRGRKPSSRCGVSSKCDSVDWKQPTENYLPYKRNALNLSTKSHSSWVERYIDFRYSSHVCRPGTREPGKPVRDGTRFSQSWATRTWRADSDERFPSVEDKRNSTGALCPRYFLLRLINRPDVKCRCLVVCMNFCEPA